MPTRKTGATAATAKGPMKPRKRTSHSVRLRVQGRMVDTILEQKDVKAWDDEELERGYQKDKGGKFRGNPPKVVPRVCHDELVRRRLVEGISLMKKNSLLAVEVLSKILESPAAEDRDKIKAAEIILKTVLPARLDLTVDVKQPKFIDALRAAIVPGDEADDIIDDDDILDVESREAS